jgi:hypothetical protein
LKRRDLISGLFWFAIGLMLSIWSTSYQIGSIVQPGPGFLPLGLGLLIILLSIILLIGAIKSLRPVDRPPSSSTGGAWKRVGYAVLVLMVTAFFFEKLGYLLTFFLLILLLMLGAAGRQNWKRILLVAILSALGVYVVFVRLLEQPLPRGLLGV